MAERVDTRRARERASRSGRSTAAESPALFLIERAEDALAAIGSRLAAEGLQELRLVGERGIEASWHGGRSAEPPAAAGGAERERLEGEPALALEARCLPDAPWPRATARVAAGWLEAWRHVRAAEERLERVSARRSLELDLIQSLARRAAEASSVTALFATAVGLLQRVVELDLAVAGALVDGEVGLELFLARPVARGALEDVLGRTARFLGQPGETAPRRRVELDGWDPAAPALPPPPEGRVILLPLLRRTAPAGALLLVVARDPTEPELRLLHGAANQIAVHLDRILAVREAAEHQLRALFEALPQGVVRLDAELRPRQANRAAHRLLGEGAADGAAFAAEMAELGLVDTLRRVARGGEKQAETEVRLPGDRTWAVTATRLPDPDTGSCGLVLVLADVSERRRAQQYMAQVEKMSSLGQLVSGVAHELNNPLASILGYAQLMAAGCADEKLRGRVAVLRSEAERCRKIVHSLLSFARRREPEVKPLSLNQSVLNVLSLMAYQLRVADVRVGSELDRDLPALLGDAHQLEQVLVNLLTNAHQALRPQGGGEIRVRTAIEGEGVLLEVRDDGPGIPEAVRSRIFDPFFTTKEPGEGTGLGLALAYGIVSAHGGTIEACPVHPRGTAFRIRLPRPPALPATGDEPGAALPPRGPCGGRVLVVDDEPAISELIRDALADDGHDVVIASDARQALEMSNRQRFDVVVSDFRMPGIDGRALHRELARADPALAARLLVTTGDVGGDAESFASETGVVLLHKPFDLEDLVRHVREKLAVE